MEEITVVIPVNFTDAGRLFGLFEIRSVAAYQSAAPCLSKNTCLYSVGLNLLYFLNIRLK